MTTEQLTAELQAAQAANDALLEGFAGLGVAYLANRVRDLERRNEEQAGIIVKMATRMDALESSLSKARQAFTKLTARTDDQKTPTPTPAKGAAK